jgi:methylmalonyl-CoA mutase, C-terminal domain
MAGDAFVEAPDPVPPAAMNRPIRVLIAKPGLDGHDRGAKVVARALRDAGMEVVYTGLRQSAEAIVSAALQEDVDAVGLSVLSGSHLQHFADVRERLTAAGMEGVLLFGGGIVPDADRAALRALGVGEVFGPGSSTAVVVDYLRREVARRRSESDDA